MLECIPNISTNMKSPLPLLAYKRVLDPPLDFSTMQASSFCSLLSNFISFSLLLHLIKTSLMASSTEPLVIYRIIGDVVDMFVPSIAMNVYYGSKHVTNGCNIKPSIAVNPPRVTISGDPHELYTLVMTDPDAPNPSDPSMREYVHWIVTNIPGGSNSTQGDEILPYIGPQPTIGIHRYILVLLLQKGRLGVLREQLGMSSRENFNTRAFAHQLELSTVATVYFNAQKEPTSKRKRTPQMQH